MHDTLADRQPSLELLKGEPTPRLHGCVKVVLFTRHYFRWTRQTFIHCIYHFLRSRCHLQDRCNVPSRQEVLRHLGNKGASRRRSPLISPIGS